MFDLPEAGVGIIYLPGLQQLLEPQLHLIDTIEIEPQTLWYNKDATCGSFNFNMEQTSLLQEYHCNKLFHSVGFPVGGTVKPNKENLALLATHARQLNPLWISEHLSFNIVEENKREINTNFLLPPCQSKEGIGVAVNAIHFFTSHFNLPFAFETGTNYLQPQKHEIPDGQFVSAIAEKADCHILLDLHNIMANELNGRQSINDFINQLPPERVCEIHIAGGFFHNNYYLDAHSGMPCNELFEILDKLVRKLPQLKALIFEMQPEYATDVSPDEMSRQLERMHRIYDNKGRDAKRVKNNQATTAFNEPTLYSVKEWETTLGRLVLEKQVPETSLSIILKKDKGIPIISDLIFNFRASMIVSALKLSSRLLRLSMGNELFIENLKQFFASSSPEMLAYAAAVQYAAWLDKLQLDIPYLYQLVAYELAALNTLADNQSRSVEFDYNPFPVFRSLMNAELPGKQSTYMPFVLNIEADQLHSNEESFNYFAVYHN